LNNSVPIVFASCLLLQILLLLALVQAVAAADSLFSRSTGIAAPQEWGLLYDSATATFGCKDDDDDDASSQHHRRFAIERFNDNFCDCLDGTDEPGTSACPDGKFYCNNVGYVPQYVFSSRINDGICDCCDGSDEYDGRIECANTCWQVGREAREKLTKKLAMYKEGLRIRRREVQNARVLRLKQETEVASLRQKENSLGKLIQKLKEAVDKLERQQEQASKAMAASEKSETDQKPKEEELPDGSSQVSAFHSLPTAQVLEAQTSELSDHHDMDVRIDCDAGAESDCELDASKEDAASEESHEEGDSDLAQLSREEMGRIVASRWTGEEMGLDTSHAGSDQLEMTVEDCERTEDEPDGKDDNEFNGGNKDDGLCEGGNGCQDEGDTTYREEEEEEHQPLLKQEKPAWWTWFCSVAEMLRNLFTRSMADKSEAEQVRKQYSDATGKLSSIKARISELDTILKQDFGEEGEFTSFYEQCFELKVKQYVYKVCPFQEAMQLEGHTSTHLGDWDGFKDNYSAIMFSHGEHCWNGPNRSLWVELQCGKRTQLKNVDEPSRCEYVAELTTPVFCSESRVEQLQQELDGQLAAAHDEL
jgi:protein kinase C substrate 80K-H